MCEKREKGRKQQTNKKKRTKKEKRETTNEMVTARNGTLVTVLVNVSM
jgi:hypothetical protein